MIKPEELRIGSIVTGQLPNGEKCTLYTYSISPYGSEYADDKGMVMLYINTMIEPIPLSEEWLGRLGFEQHMFTWEKERFSLMLRKVQSGEIWIENQEGFRDAEHVKHVHQLQNLYFALTGEELTVK